MEESELQAEFKMQLNHGFIQWPNNDLCFLSIPFLVIPNLNSLFLTETEQ